MDGFLKWFAAGGGSIVAYSSTLLALVVMVFVPKPIRRRLRLAVVLGVVGAIVDLITRRLADAHEHPHVLLESLAFMCSALASTRVAYVLLVDLLIERAGSRPINRLVRDVSQAALYGLASLVALQAADVSAASMLATTTVVSAVVALSAQETLGNLFAGIAIELEKPIAVGDWIRVDKGDLTGRVVAASWRSVTIVTDDRAFFVIPNSIFSKTPFSNYSKPGGSVRRNLYFTIPFEFPPAHVHEALLAACADSPEVLADPAPSALTWTYGETGITYWLRYYIADFARRDPSQGDVTTRIWYQLHRRKITAAVPVRQTYLHQVDQATAALEAVETLRDRRAAIDVVDFLHPLTDEAKQALAAGGHRRLFGPRETIIRQGEKGRTFYMIRRGSVAIVIDGKQLKTLKSGDFFGELALLTGSQRFASVVALEETEVFEIDEHEFRIVLRSDPKLAEAISTIVAQRRLEMAQSVDPGPASHHDAHSFAQEILAKIKNLFALD